MTDDAQKRLEAISAAEDLGAGFTLATYDMEIRGAGELLGDEQSGQIQTIGFSLYMEMLDRAVKAIRQGKQADDRERHTHLGRISRNFLATRVCFAATATTSESSHHPSAASLCERRLECRQISTTFWALNTSPDQQKNHEEEDERQECN